MRGERNIAAINLIRIAKILKIEVGELFPLIRSLNINQEQSVFLISHTLCNDII